MGDGGLLKSAALEIIDVQPPGSVITVKRKQKFGKATHRNISHSNANELCMQSANDCITLSTHVFDHSKNENAPRVLLVLLPLSSAMHSHCALVEFHFMF